MTAGGSDLAGHNRRCGEEVGGHGDFELPRDADRSLARVLDVVGGSEEQIWLGAKFVGLFLADEQQDRAS